jgi:hypothetical protein
MAATRLLTRRDINRATLARQLLLARARMAPLEAIERLVAIQAQWPRPPFVGLWTRLAGFERSALHRLFMERRAVRATFLRATIHVVSAADFLAFRPAIQPALEGSMQAILRERTTGLDLQALARGAGRLLGKRPQTFEELRAALRREHPEADERAMGYAVRMLLPLVQVPTEDAPWAFPARAGFAPAAQWLSRPIASKPSLPDGLLLRYLAAYGPATPRDFQAWSGLAPEAVREAFARLRPRLDVFRDEQKRELFDLPDAPRPGGDAAVPVRLIPEYDNLITTRADERVVAKSHRPRVFLPGLRIAATVLVDGFAAATWRLDFRKPIATVTVDPFGALPRRVRTEIEAEAEALARFAQPEARTWAVAFAS